MQKLLIAIFMGFPFALSAQVKDTVAGKNIIKLNISALAVKNISVQYERALGGRKTITGLLRFMPESTIPFKGIMKSILDEPETEEQLDNARIGNIAFTSELRFYLGKKGVFHGFYVAPFASIARYKAALDYLYTDLGIQKSIPLSGGVTTFTGGVLLGSQWNLGSRFYLDLWFLGPHYGTSDGSVTGTKTLNFSEQNSLRQELEELDLPLTKTTYEVNGNGASVFFKGPWAGLRTGINIGIRF